MMVGLWGSAAVPAARLGLHHRRIRAGCRGLLWRPPVSERGALGALRDSRCPRSVWLRWSSARTAASPRGPPRSTSATVT